MFISIILRISPMYVSYISVKIHVCYLVCFRDFCSIPLNYESVLLMSDTFNIIFIFHFIYLLCVWVFSLLICLGTTYAKCCRSQNRASDTWNWNYRWLWDAMWEMLIKPGSSWRKIGALSHWEISPASSLRFFLYPEDYFSFTVSFLFSYEVLDCFHISGRNGI